MKLSNIIREELARHISISAYEIRDAITATIENMDIEDLVADALQRQLASVIEDTVLEVIDDVVEEVVNEEIE